MTPTEYAEVLEEQANVELDAADNVVCRQECYHRFCMDKRERAQKTAAHLRALAKALREAKEQVVERPDAYFKTGRVILTLPEP